MPSIPVTSRLFIDLEILIAGNYEPYDPGISPSLNSPGEAPSGETVEDAHITDIIYETTATVRGVRTITRSSLLRGIDTSSSEIQKLLENLYSSYEADIIEELRTDAAE